MGVRAVNFLGRNFYLPGSFAAFRARPQPTGPSDDLQTLIVIAQSDNGVNVNDTNLEESARYYVFQDFNTAQTVLRGGEGLEALARAFAPSSSPDFPPPQFVKFLNVNPNTAASRALANTAGANTTITAAVPGPAGNLIRLRKVLTDKEIFIASEDAEERSGPLDLPVFQIQYTGDATTATMAVSATQIQIVLAGDQTDGSVNQTLSFSQYKDLARLAAFLSQQTGFTISTLAATDFQLKYLDLVSTPANIKTAAYTARADGFAEMVFLDGTGLVSVTFASAPLANMTTFAFLTGGTTGVPAVDAWTKAIDFCEDLGGLYRHLHNTTLSNQFYFRDSIHRLNAPEGQNETLGSTGANTTDTLAVRRANARGFASRYLVYGVTKIVCPDLAGDEKVYGGLALGLLHNALKAGSDPRISATWKPLNYLRTAETHTRLDRIGIVRDGGLAAGRVVKGGVAINAILRAVTTEQQSNLLYNESNAIALGLAAVRELREHMSVFIGEVPVDPLALVQGPTEADLKREFEQKMDSFVLRGWLRGSSTLGIPAWYRDDYKIVIDGDAFYFLDARANPVLPINFIFPLLNFEVIAGAA